MKKAYHFSSIGGRTYASFEGVCRDPETGLDHAIVLKGSGQYFDIQIWSVDSASGNPILLHSEGWGDSVYPPGYEWGLDLLMAKDGACRWRERQDADKSFKAGMAALRIGTTVEANEREIDLPTRPLPAAAVRHWLAALKNAATFEGAVYADGLGRDSWLVVQVLGKTLCDAPGVVLVLDRRAGSWRTIYDVPSGCSKTLNYPLRGMVVKGDRLFASICKECDSWGLYNDYAIDLRSYRATFLDSRNGELGSYDDENPIIHGIDEDLLAHPDH